MVVGMLSSPTNAAIIDIRSQATLTNQSVVQLQDIATVSDVNPTVVQELNGIMLMPAPAPGRSLRFSYDDLRSRLQAHGVSLISHEIRGASATEIRSAIPAPVVNQVVATPNTPVRIRPESQVVDPGPKDVAKANEVVRTAFRRAFRTEPWEARGIEIACTVDPADAHRLSLVDAALIRFRTAGLQVGTPQNVDVYWEDPQTEPQQAVVVVSLAQKPLTLAMKVSLPTGAILRPEDLEWVPAEGGQAGLNRVADAVGMELVRPLKAGHRLTKADIATVPLIKANDLVTVLVKRPGVTVSRRFKALSSGALGETVNLVAVDDPRLRVQATVSRYHEAIISESSRSPVGPRIQDGTGTIDFVSQQGAESGGTTR